MAVLLVIAILVGLIVAHEFGHFIAAKIFGIGVEEFGIGYPPRAFTIGTFGGTVYTLNWLPFGGFVRLFGENPQDVSTRSDQKKSFSHVARPKQLVVLLAGVVMNALCAWILFALALQHGMLASVSPQTPGARLIVSEVLPGSPAAIAGLSVGDELVSLSDDAHQSPQALSADGVIEYVRAHAGKQISITYLREGATSTVSAAPSQAVLEGLAAQPALGIALDSVAPVHLTTLESLKESWWFTSGYFKVTASRLYALVRDSFHGSSDLSQVAGPVGLVSVVSDAEAHGIGYLLELAAVIAINLSLINLIPLPALDGGRAVIVLCEAVIRRPIPRQIVDILNICGFAFLLVCMVAVTYHDILNLLR